VSWLEPLPVVKGIGLLSVALSIALGLAVAVLAPDTLVRRLLFRYVATLERRMRLMFIDTRGLHVVVAQGAAIVLALGLAVSGFGLQCLLAIPLIAAAPLVVLERMRKKRVQRIERVLDGFVLALANAMRAMPSAGKALASIQAVTPPPLDREIELVLREMRVGSTLDQALGNLSARVRSFQLDAAMSGLLIGRQTGGNVPEILDGAAQTLREMARLQGVLRAKTAEGRAQANVLAAFPLLLLFAFDMASPGYFRPLTESATGVMVMLIALGLWLSSVILMRRIMEVEL
jgi:tight adherence protein B